MDVPFLDLAPIHAPLKQAILADLGELIDGSGFINGPPVKAFEDEFAAWAGRRHAVGVASGTDALRLALIAAGVGPGDEVLVPASTFIATFEAVSQAGARPVVVDVGERDWNLDAGAAQAAVTGRTRAVLPVHLYGQMADMRAIGALAERHGLVVVEDACQAHGAERDGLRAGTCGLAGAFSFYPGKNLGAMGDAGALVTDDADLASAVRALREHGQRHKYEHETEGWTARLDAFQAAVLRRKLPLLEGWNAERAAIARRYRDALAGVGDLELAPELPGSRPVHHLFVVRTADPAGLADRLAAHGVATGRHYPQPAHLTGAYAHLGHAPGSFPVAERLAASALSLPIFPGMTDAQVEAVVDGVLAAFGAAGRTPAVTR